MCHCVIATLRRRLYDPIKDPKTVFQVSQESDQ